MEKTRGILWGVLLRDTEDENRFVGTGAWETFQDIAFWRWDPGFEQRLAAISELVDHVDSRTMELVAGRDPDEKTPPSSDEP
jgi:hypothetical protein